MGLIPTAAAWDSEDALFCPCLVPVSQLLYISVGESCYAIDIKEQPHLYQTSLGVSELPSDIWAIA